MRVGTPYYALDLPEGYVEHACDDAARYVNAGQARELTAVSYFVCPGVPFDDALRASVDSRVAEWEANCRIVSSEPAELTDVGILRAAFAFAVASTTPRFLFTTTIGPRPPSGIGSVCVVSVSLYQYVSTAPDPSSVAEDFQRFGDAALGLFNSLQVPVAYRPS
jgi:hypothetical protein